MQLSEAASGGLDWPLSQQVAIAAASGVGGPKSFANAPTTVAFAAGRVWRAAEVVLNSGVGGVRIAPMQLTCVVSFKFSRECFGSTHETGLLLRQAWGASVVVHALADPSRSLRAAHWEMSEPVAFAKDWPAAVWPPPGWGGEWGAKGWLEGGAVAGADGESLFVALRMDILSESVPPDKAVLMKHSGSTEGQLVFDSVLEQFPGGHSKFAIRRDTITGLFCSFVDNTTAPGPWTEARGGERARLARNHLALSCSADLHSSWTTVATVLFDDTGLAGTVASLEHTGFQYVDWHFDGPAGADIVMVVRAGYRGANSFHNSNRILFKKITDWRQLLSGLLDLQIGGGGWSATDIDATFTQPARFDSATLSYEAVVPSDATAVEITPTAFTTHGKFFSQTIVINGAHTVGSGQSVAVAFPPQVNKPGDSMAVTVSVKTEVATHAGFWKSITAYRLTLRRASTGGVTVAGSGFEIRRLSAGGAAPAPAWSGREWFWDRLPPQLTGMSYTMLTCDPHHQAGTATAVATVTMASSPLALPGGCTASNVTATVTKAPTTLFAAVPVVPGCESATCAKFEVLQKAMAELNFTVTGLAGNFSASKSGAAADTNDVLIMRLDIGVAQTVALPESTGMLIVLFWQA